MLNYVLYLFSFKMFQQNNEVVWLHDFSFTTNVFEMLAFSPDTELEKNRTVGISYEMEMMSSNMMYK